VVVTPPQPRVGVEDDDDTGHVAEEGRGSEHSHEEARGEICPLTFLVGRIFWKKYAL
jgi:hypothetical protein